MRIARISHLVFASVIIGVGIVGLFNRALMPIWNPLPESEPAHQLLAYVAIGTSLLSGIGLLMTRTAAMGARFLVSVLSMWMLWFRLPKLLREPLFPACWSVFPLAVMLSAATVSYVWSAAAWDHDHLRMISGAGGMRIARCLYGLSLIFFGFAHFIDVRDTISLIPTWLPGHLFWAYVTGAAFIAAGLAVITGICARLAAALAALQIASFLFLVWTPIVVAGFATASQWSETILNAALLAGAWIMADSYRGTWWSRIPLGASHSFQGAGTSTHT